MAAQSMALSKPLNLNGTVRILFPTVLVVLLIVIGLCALVWFKRPDTGAARAAASSRALGSGHQPLPTVRSTLNSDGFSPASANCSAGKTLLSISNQSGAANLTLQLTRGNGQPVAEYGLTAGTSEFRQEVDLQSGEYVLKEMSHSAWVFQITVQ